MSPFFIRLVLFAGTLLPYLGKAQLTDDFSDGNFSANPVWYGDTAHFRITSDGMLQLSAPNAGKSALYTSFDVHDSLEWRFFLRLDFAPSASNRVQVYLCAGDSTLESAQSWFLEIGENGSVDALKLFRRNADGTSVLLGSGPPGAVSAEPVEAAVTARRSGGVWRIDCTVPGQSSWSFSAADSVPFGSGKAWLGWVCTYSSTRKDKFYSDDFSISIFQQDLHGPQLMVMNSPGDSVISLVFDEPLDSAAATAVSHYRVNQQTPLTAGWERHRPDSVALVLTSPVMPGEVYAVEANGIADRYGNVSFGITAEYTPTSSRLPEEFAVLISEIMADPSPSMGLPEYEWIELYNNSPYPLDLSIFTLEDATGLAVDLPVQVLPPGGYVVLVDAAVIGNFSLPNLAGLSGWPSLNNEADEIILRNKADQAIIDRVAYRATWHTESAKSGGGWSLERRFLSQPCAGRTAWVSCPVFPGGTPGIPNASRDTTPDRTAPLLLSAVPITPDTLVLTFSERIHQLDRAGIFLTPVIGIDTLFFAGNDQVRVVFSGSGLQPGMIYTLAIGPSWSDCAGHPVTPGEIITGIPALPEPGEILINEILFNPVTGGVRFLELYNASDRLFACGDIWIADVTRTTAPVQMPGDRLFLPRQLLVCTPDTQDIAARYNAVNPQLLVEMPLPSWDDSEGNITVFRAGVQGQVVLDSVSYNDDWHHVF